MRRVTLIQVFLLVAIAAVALTISTVVWRKLRRPYTVTLYDIQTGT